MCCLFNNISKYNRKACYKARIYAGRVYLENIFKALKEQNIGNVVVAWYIANDSSVGINILIKGYGIQGIDGVLYERSSRTVDYKLCIEITLLLILIYV